MQRLVSYKVLDWLTFDWLLQRQWFKVSCQDLNKNFGKVPGLWLSSTQRATLNYFSLWVSRKLAFALNPLYKCNTFSFFFENLNYSKSLNNLSSCRSCFSLTPALNFSFLCLWVWVWNKRNYTLKTCKTSYIKPQYGNLSWSKVTVECQQLPRWYWFSYLLTGQCSFQVPLDWLKVSLKFVKCKKVPILAKQKRTEEGLWCLLTADVTIHPFLVSELNQLITVEPAKGYLVK